MKSIMIDSAIASKLHRIYKCSVCNEIFNEKNMYRNHMLHHEKDNGNTYSCNICGKSFAVPARLTRHYRTHTGEKPFQCEYCKKSFSVKENLSVHRRIHTKERPYKCEICEKAFEHSGKLHRHMRVHTGERPHKCLSCNKTFIQSGQLVIHTRTHTGEKPYVCKSCKKGFTCSKQLKVHSRTHTGEKPYKCDICNKSFGYNHVLKLHQAAHYGEKFYKCILCQHTFNSKKLMEIHLKTHSEQSIHFLPESISTSENFHHKLTNNNDQSLFIKNKIECQNQQYNNSFKAWEEKKTHEPSISLYKDYYTQINTEANENISFQTSPKTYTSTNSKSFFSKQISFFNTKINCIKNFSVDNEILSKTQDYDNFTSGKSCFYKIQDVYQEQNESRCNFDCTNITQDGVDNIIKQKYNQKDYINNSQDIDLFRKLSAVQHDKIQSALFGNAIDLEETSRKEIISLPPRKRTKMILESMEIEKIESTNKNQHHSVIKFAKGNNFI